VDGGLRRAIGLSRVGRALGQRRCVVQDPFDALGCSDWSTPVRGNTGASLKVSLSGAGKVTSSPAGINCGGGASDCNEAYLPGTVVRLTARGAGNINKPVYWLFDHWEGACAGQGYVCTLTMSAARSAKAVFVRETNGGL